MFLHAVALDGEPTVQRFLLYMEGLPTVYSSKSPPRRVPRRLPRKLTILMLLIMTLIMLIMFTMMHAA